MKDEPAHPSSFRLHPSPLSPGAAASRRSSFDGYPGEFTRIGAGLLGAEGAILVISPGCVSRSARLGPGALLVDLPSRLIGHQDEQVLDRLRRLWSSFVCRGSHAGAPSLVTSSGPGCV
jgi:hypothetical protein